MRREVVKLEAGLVQRARNAVVFLRSHGEPLLTITELIDRAVTAHLDELVAERNGGEEFPETGHLPRAGQMSKGA